MPKACPYSSGRGSGGTAPRARASHSTASPSAAREAGEAEGARVRLVHHANRRVERLGALDDRLQIARLANPLADPFETRADLPSRVVGGCCRRRVRTAHEVVARVAFRRQVSKRRIVVLANQPGVHEVLRRLNEGQVGLDPHDLRLGRRRRNRRLIGLRRDVPGHDLPVPVLPGPQ